MYVCMCVCVYTHIRVCVCAHIRAYKRKELVGLTPEGGYPVCRSYLLCRLGRYMVSKTKEYIWIITLPSDPEGVCPAGKSVLSRPKGVCYAKD